MFVKHTTRDGQNAEVKYINVMHISEAIFSSSSGTLEIVLAERPGSEEGTSFDLYGDEAREAVKLIERVRRDLLKETD